MIQDTLNIKIPNKYKHSSTQLNHSFLGNNDNNNMKCKYKLVKNENNLKEIIDNINNDNENKYLNN